MNHAFRAFLAIWEARRFQLDRPEQLAHAVKQVHLVKQVGGTLPADLAKKLPRRQLQLSVLAWLGVDRAFQGRGIGRRVLATSVVDCYDASQTFAFIAVILDCVDEQARRFYRRFDFAELAGHPMRLYLPFKSLESLAKGG
ncbi:MAG TPA: hypothetical protein DDZ51_12905 [Planctomycetaceae bacterium]|nr:hypothetical protein [Planctomycetaceae bacterium]